MANRLPPAVLLAILGCLAAPVSAMPPTVSAESAASKAKKSGAGVMVVLSTEPGKETSVSLFSEKSSQIAVAKAGDGVVTLREFAEAMASVHEEHDPASKGSSMDFRPVLDRLVRARLIVGEARAMGMADLPEVKKGLADFDEVVPREILKSRATSKVKPDAKAVDRLYRAATRQNVIATVLFQDEASAKAFEAQARKGGDFASMAREAVAKKKATAYSLPALSDPAGVSPEILAGLNQMKPGAISPVFRVPRGFAVVQLARIQYRKDPKAKADAVAQVSAPLKRKALEDYYLALRKKYATIDAKLLAEVDLDGAEPGFKAYLKDQRPLVQIVKETPVTVADVAGEIDRSLFHGAERAAEGKKLNSRKTMALDNLMFRRLLDHEAKVQKVRETPEFRRLHAKAEDDILFKTFMDTVIVPGIQTADVEVERYYQEHRAEYTRPAMLRMEAVGFVSTKAAQSAADLLRSGTDLAWLKANADGILPGERASFQPGTKPVISTDLPEALAKAVAGAKAGDYRVYTVGKDEAYVVRITEIVPASVRPLEEVRPEVLQALGFEKVKRGFMEYSDKLRQAHDVKIYVVRIVS